MKQCGIQDLFAGKILSPQKIQRGVALFIFTKAATSRPIGPPPHRVELNCSVLLK